MNCKKVLTLIEDYHFGGLSQELAAEVASHLNSCTGCSRELESLVREEQLYHSYSGILERDLEIRPFMWQAVRSGLQKKADSRTGLKSLLTVFEDWLPQSRAARYAVFAAFVACISIGGTLLAVRMLAPAAPERASSASLTPGSGLEAALQSLQRAETEYLGAIRILSAIVDKQKESLDPAQRAELERNLRALDQGIARARQAYHAHPSDPELGFYMLAAYREKVELLQELATS